MSAEAQPGAEPAPTDVRPDDSIETVSLVVRHTVRADAIDRYEAWLREVVSQSAAYPGHQGRHIIRPTAASRTYTTIVRYATLAQATTWATSAERARLIASIADALETGDSLDIQPGIDFWFTPSEGAPRKAKPWKQWLITTSVIWPLTMLVPVLLQPLFHAVPAFGLYGVSNLFIAAAIVALVTWVIMPPYVRRVSSWLFR